MSDDFKVEAQSRQDVGRGASRRQRRIENFVPAIVYGADKPAIPVTIDHNKMIKHLENEAFYSHILSLAIDGNEEKVVLKAIQRHPSKRRILHMDFLRIKAGSAITMNVPIHFLNEETAPGVKEGGVVSHVMTDFEVNCLPKDLPEYIEVDLGQLEMDGVVHLSEVKVPEGVTLALLSHEDDNDPAIASIHMPRAVVEEETPAEEAEAGAEDKDDKGSSEASEEGSSA